MSSFLERMKLRKLVTTHGLRPCNRCMIKKPLSAFQKCATSPFGIRTICAECTKRQRQEYRNRNKAKLLEAQKAYRELNKNKLNKKRSAARKARRKVDPVFDLICRLRKRLWEIVKFKGLKKRTSFYQSLGCETTALFEHIQKQFKDGMNWDNRHLWHIDHIIPLSSAKTIEDVYRLNHYTNLQPLWASENLSKGSKIPKAG